MRSQELRAFDGQFGFEAIIRHATIGIVVVEQGGLIKMCNPCANDLFGYKDDELTGSSLNLLIPEAQRQNHAHYQRNYFNNPTDRPMGNSLKLNACRKDGSIFPVEISLAHYRQQEKLMVIAFITDITRREEAESRMRMNEQQIRLLIEHTPASIAMFDREMRYIIHSKRWLQDYRLGDKDIIGLSHYEVFPEIGDSWKTLHARCLAGEELRSPEDPFLRIDGRTDWVQWELCPWYKTPGEVGGVILFTEVITERKYNEERIREYTEHLEEEVEKRSQSLEKTIIELQRAKVDLSQLLEKEKELGQLKSKFVTLASHEFRTPLSAIQLSASLIEKYAEPDHNENINKHIKKIKSATVNLTGILNDFLSLEKLESGKITANYSLFDIEKFTSAIVEEMQLLTRLNQQILYRHTGGEKMVFLDPDLLKNCVINLASNAIKYSGENSLIEIVTEITEANYAISVKDNGIGIPEFDQKHLFEPFFRANNTGNIQGTGLGLNIVQRYTHLMKGKVEFKSQLKQGTEFTLAFPNSFKTLLPLKNIG